MMNNEKEKDAIDASKLDEILPKYEPLKLNGINLAQNYVSAFNTGMNIYQCVNQLQGYIEWVVKAVNDVVKLWNVQVGESIDESKAIVRETTTEQFNTEWTNKQPELIEQVNTLTTNQFNEDWGVLENRINTTLETQNTNIQNIQNEQNELETNTNNNINAQNTKINSIQTQQTNLASEQTNLASEQTNLASQQTTLSNRMDTFTSLSEGSTTGDAELQDIRVGANGVTYPNAGDAVRGQYSQLKEDLDDVSTIAINGESVYFYQEHPKGSYYTENVNLKANQTYTIYVDSTVNCSVTTRDASDNRTEIVSVWGETTKEFTPKTDITSLILWINDTTSPTSQTFIVKIYRGKIKDEIKKLKKTKDIKVAKDGTGNFTKLVDAVNYVNSNSSIKFTVHVGSGTYDLIEELGEEYFADYKGVGLVLNNNAHYIFSSNSKVVCNYVGDNENIKKYFSPFNCSNNGDHTGFILENLTLECANVRYAIHDEVNGQIAPFKNEYINCHITLDNSQNTQGYRQCIGGGLGCASEVIIKNCYFKSIGTSNAEIVTYHNVNSSSNDNYRSNVTIDSCYFADTNTCRCSYCGISEKISRMIVSNCSLGAEPRMIAETSSSLVNFELIKWNNEIRS